MTVSESFPNHVEQYYCPADQTKLTQLFNFQVLFVFRSTFDVQWQDQIHHIPV